MEARFPQYAMSIGLVVRAYVAARYSCLKMLAPEDAVSVRSATTGLRQATLGLAIARFRPHLRRRATSSAAGNPR
jgi:hypothetical protein